MDASLGALRNRLLEMRAWDSSGTTFDNRVREALNTALDRMSGDVPEALIPAQETIVLLPDTDSSAHNLKINATSEKRVLKLTDTAGVILGDVASADATARSWYTGTYKSDGTWDGLMHLEITDSSGVTHRRQAREWFTTGATAHVTIDRPWPNTSDTLMAFRIYQPEFFVHDDVMEVLEPARVYDSGRQQVWSIDTAGAYRQDMVDFQANSTGVPYRMWRGRHFQLPAPRQTPLAEPRSTAASDTSIPPNPWAGPEQEGSFRFCFTYVWGKRDDSVSVAPGTFRDPLFESAPSPVSEVFDHTQNTNCSILVQTTNIDAMQDFGDSTTVRYGKSGLRIRIYVARDSVRTAGLGSYNRVESAGIFYLLTEIEPTNAAVTGKEASFVWTGSITPDYHRPLKHSTGYYSYSVFPHQDARYELDFRVLKLPMKFDNDQDTAPIQRDAVPALLELALYYMSLIDGVDQQGAQLHMERYNQLVMRYRLNYANPGRVVEPVPIGGHYKRSQFGTFSNTD